MPMLYGEGDKAFLRLQEEILKTSTDLLYLLGDNTTKTNKNIEVYSLATLESLAASRIVVSREVPISACRRARHGEQGSSNPHFVIPRWSSWP